MSYHGVKKNKNAYKIPVDSIPLPTRTGTESKSNNSNSGILTGGSGGGEEDGGVRETQRGSSSGGREGGEGGGSKPMSWNLGGAGVGGQRGTTSPRQSGGDDGYEHIPDNLRRSFNKQMTELLSANDRLNEQNEMLKKNRGVKIDHDQFKSWKNQIDDLRFALEEAEEKEKLLTEENGLQAERIRDLEEELRRLRMRGKDQEEEIKGLKMASKPKWGEGTRSQDSQTKHTGAIPVVPKKVTMSSLGGTQTDVKYYASSAAQTEEEVKKEKPATPRKKALEKITDAELDNMMIMEELNEIRKIMELDKGEKDNSSSKAWSEVCSHGVMGGVSAVKQRARTFRQELDYLRKQVRQFKTEAAVRRISGGGIRGSPVKRNSFTMPAEEKGTTELGSPPVKFLSIGGPSAGGVEQRLTEKNSTIFNGRGGARRGSKRGNGEKLPIMSGSPLTVLQEKQAALKAHITGGGGGGGGSPVPRRPSGVKKGEAGGPHFVGQPGGYS